ncbi:MAG TPA: UDP-N-acetylmuramate dehydrogenase [Bacteroidales bacterium]|nr:UDP-N-acetylmuramate dehydrogenase [Bacteroidales bacterium]
MKTEFDVSLKKYNTFGLDYKAERIIHLVSEKETSVLLSEDYEWKEKFLTIGGGSNLLFTGDFKGTLLHPVIMGIDIIEDQSGDVIVSAGSGIVWDDLVKWTVENGFSGLENLSLIPGNVGASPVQNIGAYGVEVSDIIEKVDTVRVDNGEPRSFDNSECGFRYRYSIFKGEEKGRFVVTRIFFRLRRNPVYRLDYGSLREEVNKLGDVNLLNIRRSVINIRRNKLPDPEITGNAGSFFKNPVVPEELAEELSRNYPGMPVYNEKPGYKKIAAGWLIEQCGWKGKRIGETGTYGKQALIIINYGNATGSEIFEFSENIRRSVLSKFSIELEREVEVVPSI